MNSRIDQGEDPDRSCDVTDTCPHAHHGTGVMVRLQGRALLTLGQNDDGVKDLVELGQVEDPAEEGQTLIPETTKIGGVRNTSCSQTELGVAEGPLVNGSVVRSRVTVTPGSIDLAQRIGNSCDVVGIIPTGP